MLHWTSGSLCDLVGQPANSRSRAPRILGPRHLDEERQKLEEREEAQKSELERGLLAMNSEKMERMKQIDAELADQIEELHLEMATRANEAIARHKESIAEIEEEKATLEKQAAMVQGGPHQRSRAADLDISRGPRSSSSYQGPGKRANSNVSLSESAAFGSSFVESNALPSAHSSSAFESNTFQSDYPEGSFFEKDASQSGYREVDDHGPAMLRTDSSHYDAGSTYEHEDDTTNLSRELTEISCGTGDGDGAVSEPATEAATSEAGTEGEEDEEENEEDDHPQHDHGTRSVCMHSEQKPIVSGPLSFFTGLWTRWVPGSTEDEASQDDEEEDEIEDVHDARQYTQVV